MSELESLTTKLALALAKPVGSNSYQEIAGLKAKINELLEEQNVGMDKASI